MNTLFEITAGVLLINLSLIAFFAVLGVFFPNRLGRTRQLMSGMPGRSLLVGLVNLIFLGLLALVFYQLGQKTGIFYLPALLLAALLLIGASFGLAAVAETVGERVAPQAAPFWRTACGGLLLGLGCVLPVVGWFGLLPYALLLGLGGWILTFFVRPQ
jgi:hypothetical protein